VAFLLSGTRIAAPHCGTKLNVRADVHHCDICDEDRLSVDDYTESRLKEKK